jgi:hypothetical protein
MRGLGWVVWHARAVAALAVFVVASPAQTQNFKAVQNFQTQPKVELSATAVDRTALLAARQRPQALQLRAALAKLPAERVNLAVLDRVRLPVLVSPRAELLSNLRVFAAADHYTASAKRAGMVVEINGTRLPTATPKNFRLPPMLKTVPLNTAPATQQTPQNVTPAQKQGAAAMMGHNALLAQKFSATVVKHPPPPIQDSLRDVSVQRTSYGVDVSFTRFGSVYNVTVDCGGEAEDPEALGPSGESTGAAQGECTEDKALGLAQELEVAGGGQQ